MKIIFLDIDGVLNGSGFFNNLLWEIARFFKFQMWLKKHTRDVFGAHEEKVRRLAKIVKKTGAKIVMSSSWRHRYWRTSYDEKTGRQKELADMFKKYNLEVYDITGSIEGSHRDSEILNWIELHPGVKNYVILDDENTHLRLFWNDKRFIQTSEVEKGKRITGYWYERTGLKNKHVRRAIRILNEKY